jgi:glycosyltransferase involved in cell wall biosynthesis
MQPNVDPLKQLAGAKVLFVNWRDPAHPQAGGAEVFCWEIARRLAIHGAEVTLFCSRPEGAPSGQRVDDIEVIRCGRTFSVYAHAAAFLTRNRGRFDAVIDCQNGIPFFSPLFVRRSSAVVCVIHHVHQEQFGVHFGWPLRLVGRELEGRWSRAVYGRRPLAAVSPSTQTAVREKLGLRGPIFIVPNGAPTPSQPLQSRSATPLICSVGRLAAHKRMDLLVQAAPNLRSRFPGLVVELAGDGPDRPRLQQLARNLGADGVVRFRGYVSDEAKERLLSTAWLTVNPSMGEGWGLSVLEANAHGVPAVAFRVPGLCDSVRDGVTGWLVEPGGDLGACVARALETLSQPGVADAWASRCHSWAARFAWEKSARRLANMIAAERAERSSMRDKRIRTIRDVACLVDVVTAHPERLEALAHGLRRTDLWSVHGNRARILLHGADEVAADGVVERLDLRAGTVTTSLASGYDMLVGPELDRSLSLLGS